MINEYVEPARILRDGKIQEIEPLTERKDFIIPGFDNLVGFHTSGGTSNPAGNFQSKVGECF